MKKHLKNEPLSIVYVARDIDKALSFSLLKNNLFIATNQNELSLSVAKQFPDKIFLAKDKKEILDTREILSGDNFKDWMAKIDNTAVLVFKNNNAIEKICKNNGWKIINPKAELVSQIENKVSQFNWLLELKSLLPKNTCVKKVSDINPQELPLVLQWNIAHTGLGTFLLKNESKLNALKEKFPERLARIAPFIKGPVFTSNNIASGKEILIGNISYQITGIFPFTDNSFSTIGNDWALPKKILSENQKNDFLKIVNLVGKKMADDGWKGLFGIDAILDEKDGHLYLIEINARQPASAIMESYLQQMTNPESDTNTVFENHIATLTGEKVKKMVQVEKGAQIVQRITAKWNGEKSNDTALAISKMGYNTITYKNKEVNAESLRIQSKSAIMEKHNELNNDGKAIAEIIQSF